MQSFTPTTRKAARLFASPCSTIDSKSIIPVCCPFGLTIEDIQRGISKLRNRVIGRVFQEIGLIEQWGSGIQRMTLACSEQGLDAPKFEEIGTHFRVTLSTERRNAPAKDSRDETILAMLNRHAKSGLSTAQVAKEVGVSPRSARTRLASLVDRGLVAEIGSGPQDPHRRYFPVIQETRTNPDPHGRP